MSPTDGDTPDETKASGTGSNGTGEPRIVRVSRQRGENQETSPIEPELNPTIRGSKPGTRFVRITRNPKLRRVRAGEYEATREVLAADTKLGRFWDKTRGILIGKPLASSELSHERLSKTKALAIFSSDNLSSSAYATEEILLILVLAGTGALVYSIEIALAIGVLAAIVATSYRQTIKAYPNGGGAYIVAKENLGVASSLIAGSALFVDYILTVAVSTAAGVAAVTSAFPEVYDYKIELAVFFVALLTLGNLRGVRESGTIFAIPTYFFLFTFAGMIGFGLFRVFVLGDELHATHDEAPLAVASLGPILLLRAFSSGASALTGIEAIANGVPYFKPPEAKNAATTLVWMAVLLCSFFIGITVLAHEIEVIPSHDKTVVAQVAEAVFGEGNILFYMVQAATALILILAANTCFSGLPTAASVMARDKVMPSQFAFRGDRLGYSNGILVVGVLSSVLLVIFSADTHKLIPLYAVGVFTAFTFSQAGMVVHWRRNREPGWRGAMIVNGVGAVATGVVAVIIGATKFVDGAWLSMLFMGLLALILYGIKNHYEDAQRQLGYGLDSDGGVAEQFYFASAGRPQTVVVPVETIDRSVLRTIAYARTLSENAVAIHVTDERENAEELRRAWDDNIPDVPLVIVESPYRSLIEPIMAYIEGMDRTQPNHMVTVVLPEFLTKRSWQRILHNQLASKLKKELMDRPNTVVVEVPFHFH
ncbi:MAG: APC family permease [Dehalococcoidia bacterium]